MPALTVKEMVLLHLSKYRRYRNRRVVPEDITQKGIAEAVGVQRSHISVELKRMREEKGWIEEKKAHAGSGNKKKAYFTTTLGEEKISEILEELDTRTVFFEGEEQPLRGPQAVDYLMRKADISYVWAVREVLRARRISIDSLKSPAGAVYSSPMPVVKRLYGRESEVRKLSAWYARNTPIMVLIGTGGIGKSSLAASFASSLSDPVFWYSASEEGRGTLMEELAEFFRRNGKDALHKQISSGVSDPKALESAISNADTRYLIVIDDYHAADEVTRAHIKIIKRATTLSGHGKMLVLSRAIPDFYTRKDVSLDSTVEETFLRGISQEDAMKMLKGLGLRGDEEQFRDAYSVSAGHPILLQMAAVSGGDADTMRAKVTTYLMEEFYLSMDGEEREVLARLSAFRRPVPSEAFLETEKDVDALRRLLRKGLIHYNQKGEYFVHELIRNLFQTRRKLRKEHLSAVRYYRDTGDRENLVEIINHLIRAEKYDEAENEIKAKLPVILAYGQAEILMETLAEAPERTVFQSARARAMADVRDVRGALELAARAVEGADRESRAYALWNLGIIQSISADFKASEKSLREAMESANSREERMKIQHSLGGVALVFLGRYKEAEQLEREAMEYFRKQGNKDEETIARLELAMAIARQGRLEESVDLLKQCVEYYEKERFYRNLGNTYNQMAMYEAYLGRREDARRHFEMAVLYSEMTGNARITASALMNSADNYAEMGRPEKALVYAERARKSFQEIGAERHSAVVLNVIAKAKIMMKDKSAEEAFLQAEKEMKEVGELEILADFYCEVAELIDDPERKKDLFLKALRIYEDMKKRKKAESVRETLRRHETQNSDT